MKFSLLTFAIYGLAVYRLALLFSDDSGPWKIFSRLRSFLKHEERRFQALKKSDLAHGLQCIRCNSIWLATPVAIYAACRPWVEFYTIAIIDAALLCLALSALAIVLNRAWPGK